MSRPIVLLSFLLLGCARLGFEAAPEPRPGPPGDAHPDRAATEALPGDRGVALPADRLAVIDAVQAAEAAQLPTSFVHIPTSTGPMGSPSTEACRSPNEDLHKVTLTHPYELQSTEVTRAEFQALMGYLPGVDPGCPTCPVVSLSWSEAAAYCNALSKAAALTACYVCTGSGAAVTCTEAPGFANQQIYACLGYRLPTEAEWELAYRAGTTTALYSGQQVLATACMACTAPGVADGIAWYCANATGPKPVGGKAPNGFGLYDMAGNVWEWCNDRYQTSLGTAAVTDPGGPITASSVDRVIRGGSFNNYVEVLRGAFRGYSKPTFKLVDLGFRCARTTK